MAVDTDLLIRLLEGLDRQRAIYMVKAAVAAQIKNRKFRLRDCAESIYWVARETTAELSCPQWTSLNFN
jgi:hypothetical protein